MSEDEGLATTWRRWPGLDGQYEVGLHFAEIAGRSELVGVELWSGGPPPERLGDLAGHLPTGLPGDAGPLPAVALRQLPVGRLADAARRNRLNMANLVIELHDPRDHPPETLERAERTFRSLQASRPPGGRKPIYGPEHYSEVARVYLAAWAAARPPTKAVAAWGSVQHSTAAKWVAKARALGLLMPTTKGRPSAPGPPEHDEQRQSKEEPE